MNQTPLVSIIMPVYNGEKYLQRAISSVCSQTYARWKLIVIDDGSTDRTREIVAGYPEDRILCQYQENSGQPAALNHGLRLANGDFVTTLDADDWLPEDSLALRVEYLVQHPEHDVVYGNGTYCNEDGKALMHFSDLMPTGVSDDVYDTLVTSPFYGTGAAVMIRRHVLASRALTYDEKIDWCQDWDFYIRLAEQSRFGYVPKPVIFYRLHGGGMTMTMPKGHRLQALIRLRNKVLASPRFDRVQVSQKIQFFYDYLLRDLYGNPAEQSEVIRSDPFLSLSPLQQAGLIRRTALEYVSNQEHLQAAGEWLEKSRQLNPRDPKTRVAVLLLQMSPSIARFVVRRWQGRYRYQDAKSPFEIAVKDGNHA